MQVTPPASTIVRANPLRVGMVVLAGTIVLFAIVLARFNWNPLRLVTIGQVFNQGIVNGNGGYDGQFAYYIATEGPNATPKLDLPPAFRYQRIVYPLLSALLSFGQRDLVPWAMLVIDILAHAAAAAILAHLLATQTRASPWWALVPALWVGALVSIRLDLNEPLAMAFSLAGVALFIDKRIGLAGLLFGLAGLTKDLGLILAGGLIIYTLFRRQWKNTVLLGLLSAGPYIVWALLLRLWLGASPGQPGPPRLPLILPFANLAYAENTLSLLLELLWAFVPAALIGIAAIRWLRRYPDRVEPWLAAFAALFTLYIPPANIAELIGTLRIIQPLLVASILFLASVNRRQLKWLAVLWAPTVILAVLIVLY